MLWNRYSNGVTLNGQHEIRSVTLTDRLTLGGKMITCVSSNEHDVVTVASDLFTATGDLVEYLLNVAGRNYRDAVLTWWATDRDTPFKVSCWDDAAMAAADTDPDVWTWQVAEVAQAA